jgi:hypothetical protein
MYFGFSKQSPFSKHNIIIELSMEKDPPWDNAIQHWLQQFQATSSVLHQTGVERLSTLEDVDQIRKCILKAHKKYLQRWIFSDEAMYYVSN